MIMCPFLHIILEKIYVKPFINKSKVRWEYIWGMNLRIFFCFQILIILHTVYFSEWVVVSIKAFKNTLQLLSFFNRFFCVKYLIGCVITWSLFPKCLRSPQINRYLFFHLPLLSPQRTKICWQCIKFWTGFRKCHEIRKRRHHF